MRPLKTIAVAEQINPIQRQHGNDGNPHEVLLDARPVHKPDSRGSAEQHGEGVKIKSRHPTQRQQRQWIPPPRERKISLRKSDRGARRTASETRKTSDREKRTARPVQAKPECQQRHRPRCYRDHQPDQLVIDSIRRNTAAHQTHRDYFTCEKMLTRLPPMRRPNTPAMAQQTRQGKSTAMTALPVSISCVRAMPMQSRTRL